MRWFLGVIAFLLVALLIESGLLAYAMYVLLAVMLVGRLLARESLGKVTATRLVKKLRSKEIRRPGDKALEAEIGDDIKVEVSIKNAGWLFVPWVLLEDLLPKTALRPKPSRLRVKGKRIQIRSLPAGKEVEMRYTLECHQRGYYQIGPLVLESGDLFGLHRRYRVEADPHFLLVYPKVVPLVGYDIASRRPIGDVRLIHRLYEDPTRIAGVRPYQAGDPLSRIHWRATARTGALHSKVYEPSTLAGATLVLDFHQAGYPSRGEPHRSELAVTTAVSLANAVYEVGQQIGLISNARDAADRIRLEGWEGDHRTRQAARQNAVMIEESERLQPLVVPTRRGVEQFQRIRETLARVELTDGLTSAELLIETAHRLPRDATVVALLADVTAETALTLGSLKRQGYAVSVVLIALDEEQQETAHGRLYAEGIMDVRPLRNEAEIPELCQQQVRRGTPYSLQVEV
jgi:uncharacterized protein (DUF58 family)